MLTRERLEQEVRSRLPPDQAEQLLALCEPCVRLLTRADSELAGSRFGGLPFLLEDVEWPTWRGRPLAFLGHLRLDELSRPGRPLPGTGLLSFFYDAEQQESWGFDPADRGAWRVIHVRDVESAAERAAPSGAPLFPRRGIDTFDEMTVPDPWEDAFLEVFNPEERRYAELEGLGELYRLASTDLDRLRATGPVHQAFGWPGVIQNPMQLEVQLASNGIYVGDPSGYENPRVDALAEGAREWRLLLQVDSDEERMWGDVGRLYFWIRESDLADGRYETGWCVLQCF